MAFESSVVTFRKNFYHLLTETVHLTSHKSDDFRKTFFKSMINFTLKLFVLSSTSSTKISTSTLLSISFG